MAFTDYLSSVQKIFIAYYQRPADSAGLRYWAQQLDYANGDLSGIIDAFANSAESMQLYGQITSTSIGSVIDDVYSSLFDRRPDDSGKEFYIDGFATGRFTPGTLVLDILNGARHSDAEAVYNKLYSAEVFTRFVDGREMTDVNFGTGQQFAVTFSGNLDSVNARNWLKAITFDTSTIPASNETEDFLKSTIADPNDPILGGDGTPDPSLTSAPTVYEQLILEIINFTRAYPNSAASSYDINLNEGLKAGTITADAKQPLAMNVDIIEGARSHSQWMLDTDLFQHEGANGSKPWDRMNDAGYTNWIAAGENIAWRGWPDTNGPAQSNYEDGADIVSDLYNLSRDLFVDEGISNRGHRISLMNSTFSEIGIGLVTGEFSGYNAIMMTQDFGARSGKTFLLGVAFDDQNGDNFYDIGEALADVSIVITNTTTGQSILTETFDSGGYQVELEDGTYSVVFEHAQEQYHGEITIAGQNTKMDLNIDLYS